MANSVITGSAAAATAFATGHKTTVRFLSVGPRTDDLLTGFEPTAEPYAPVASILEAAKLKGMATVIVVTSRVTHATPAAFACHIEDRGWDDDIIEHMVYENIDVVFGGGARHLIPSGESYTTSFGDSWDGKREDGEDLMQVLINRGYQFIDSQETMDSLTSGKVWGLFDDSHMQPDIDRQYFAENEPSLADMVGKAIELLS
jgi:alkaline phosphatase